ncbi:hypothetical protein CS542_02290 [Pedobacter sp. IW39]|nr:hypothetical protein CS542_02290 [Pedobacter sp. IW39]
MQSEDLQRIWFRKFLPFWDNLDSLTADYNIRLICMVFYGTKRKVFEKMPCLKYALESCPVDFPVDFAHMKCF